MKFATEHIWQYPPHLRHVAQIICRCGRKCKEIAFFNCLL